MDTNNKYRTEIHGTVIWHESIHTAVVDAGDRIFKSIWHHIPEGTYAIGDKEDLPYTWEKCRIEGNWYEISLKELYEDYEATLKLEREMAEEYDIDYPEE